MNLKTIKSILNKQVEVPVTWVYYFLMFLPVFAFSVFKLATFVHTEDRQHSQEVTVSIDESITSHEEQLSRLYECKAQQEYDSARGYKGINEVKSDSFMCMGNYFFSRCADLVLTKSNCDSKN